MHSGALPGSGPASSYLDRAGEVFGRVLSRQDTEPTSPSRGSFDRTWWAWKFTDFSAARFQEGAFTLAWLGTSPLAPPGASDSARLLARTESALGFWARLQHADGSFDEAYPFERSLAATAFTCFYAGSALERVEGRIGEEVESLARRALGRGAAWLARNAEHHGVLSNHLAAAAAALQVACDVLDDRRLLPARDRFLQVIYDHQHPKEGWMREYGGADPGYQSHGMFYLADVWRRSRDGRLLDSLARSCGFLAWFVHPDGTIGGEYASRGTTFAFPAAFELLAAEVPSAAAIAAHLRQAAARRVGVGPAEVDAWNLFPMLNNYLFAAEWARPLPGSPADLPWQSPVGSRVMFPDAGLAVASAAGRVIAAGICTGGSVKMWDTRGARVLYEDCGYAVARGTRFAASQAQPDSWRQSDDDAALGFELRVAFQTLPAARLHPWRFVAFRLFSLTLGRHPAVARWLKALLVRTLIRSRREDPARLQRRVRFLEDGSLRIEDRLEGLGAAPVPLPRHVPVHMGSARYAGRDDAGLDPTPCPPAERVGEQEARRTLLIAAGERRLSGTTRATPGGGTPAPGDAVSVPGSGD